MNIVLEPTREMWAAPINGVKVPVRVWTGRTDGGVAIEAYVLSIVPINVMDSPRLKVEIPEFMRPSRETFDIDVRSDADVRTQHIQKTGLEPQEGPAS